MNKIGWCDMTFNPVWGCRNHCEYCYARGIAHFRYKQMIEIEYNYHERNYPNWEGWTGRFSGLREFKPTWLEAQFHKKFPKKPQRIFVGSMSEIYYWKKEWIEMVIEKVKQYPQYTFQFLTKHSEIYNNWIWPKNCWLGVTITREEDFEKGIPYAFILGNNVKYLSIEPILEKIDPNLFAELDLDWVIIGAETGNRKGKVIPKLDWVLEIVRYCEYQKIPVYIKDNLTKYYAECRGYKQFPIQGE